MSSNVVGDVAIVVNQQLRRNRMQVFPKEDQGRIRGRRGGKYDDNDILIARLASYDLMTYYGNARLRNARRVGSEPLLSMNATLAR